MKNYIFIKSSNLKANFYGFATGWHKLFLSSVWCRKPKMVGKHWVWSRKPKMVGKHWAIT